MSATAPVGKRRRCKQQRTLRVQADEQGQYGSTSRCRCQGGALAQLHSRAQPSHRPSATSISQLAHQDFSRLPCAVACRPTQGAANFARRDQLLAIQKEQQQKWEDAKIFEVDAPEQGELSSQTCR